MAINSSNLLSEVILFIRNTLRTNITDPLSGKRATGESFVMTSYPRRDIKYPVITVRGKINGDTKLGQQSEKALVQLAIEVRVWARNEKEKNDLFGSIYDHLRTNQYPCSTANTSTNETLFDFGIDFANDLDDPGDEGIKSKISQFRYIIIAGG